MEFVGKCHAYDDVDQTITISINGFDAIVEIWTTSKSYPFSKMHLHCSFIGNDVIMCDGNGSTVILTAINNQTQFTIKGYYVLLGKDFVRFEVHHHIPLRTLNHISTIGKYVTGRDSVPLGTYAKVSKL